MANLGVAKQLMHLGVQIIEKNGEAAVVIHSQDGKCFWAFTDPEAVARLSKSLDHAAAQLNRLYRGAKPQDLHLPQHQELGNHLLRN